MKSRFQQSIRYYTPLLLLFFSLMANGQQPGNWQQGNRPAGANRQDMNIGRMYGKVVDEQGKGMGYVTVQLVGMKFDTVTKTRQEALISGQITEDNGDFNLEGLPIMGKFTLKLSFLGYAEKDMEVSFGIERPQNGQRPNISPDQLIKDLGNITLAPEAATLETVTVVGESTPVTLSLDKKIYRVDKNATSTGGTAEDALRNVPSLSVDLDGGVTLRNSSPQIFVDGRPSTLTLDQIASDAIESIEVITNPSAKYDASGGQGGIVNIVLKKDRRIGYNGNIRVGGDSRGGLNVGADINAREGKINGFASVNFNQRKGFSDSQTDREYLFGTGISSVLQNNHSNDNGAFAFARAGLDWFIDNRNTITLQGNFVRGGHSPEETQNITETYFPGNTYSESNYIRYANDGRNFRNSGLSLLFKHLFPKNGHELTADINYNQSHFMGGGDFTTDYLTLGRIAQDKQSNDGLSSYMTAQADYVNPISAHSKIEAGVRASLRVNDNMNESTRLDPTSGEWVRIYRLTDEYNFFDNVFAAYGTYSYEGEKWGYQLGLRAESSQYTGKLPEDNQEFTNNYPISLFPSIFTTYKVNEEDNLQLSYTRRINRPNFFQLMPFVDFSDSINLRKGNPDLRPEFTNSFELTYQNIFKAGHNLLVSLYYKDAYDLITSYQTLETDPDSEKSYIISTYTNSNRSSAYGMEFTLRNTFWKSVELTSNINLYNSKVDASNIDPSLVVDQFSWYAKENLNLRLPANFMIQLSTEYRSRAAFTPAGSSGRFGGHFGGPTNTAQGYTLANWFTDVAIRKDLFNRKAVLTLNVNDIFKTRKTGTHTESDLFIQDTWRLRSPQTVRVSLSYRFGKMDSSLFRRKNTNTNSDNMDMMQQ